MVYNFIKLYDEDEPDGYITLKDIEFFDVEMMPGSSPCEEDYFVVRACEKDDPIGEGYQVSPKIYMKEKAYLYLDRIMGNIQ